MNPDPQEDGIRVRHDPPPLLARARVGDARAERALYDEHLDHVYGLTLRLTGDSELAWEYTQEAFTRAFRWLETFRGEASLGTWLHRITVNVTLDGLRKVNRWQQVEYQLTEISQSCAFPEERDPILLQRIERALELLPPILKIVVVLHDIEGFTHDEIGRALGIPTGTSKARLSRARARLRPILAECAADYALG